MTADGDSQGIPVRLTVASAGRISTIESRSRAGKILLPVATGLIDLEMELLA